MAIEIQLVYGITKQFAVMADIAYKTKGWLFGSPYLDDNLAGCIGFRWKALK